MAEGTNVGNIFLDLIVRDTIDKQVQDMAAQGQKAAQKAFAGMEKAAEASANKVTAQAGKTAQKTAEASAQAVRKLASNTEGAGNKISASLSGSFSKPVEIAKSRLRQLEQEFSNLSIKAEELMRKDTSFQMYGYVSEGNKAFASVETQLDSLYRRMEAARERLAIETQAAAQKQAAAEERAARRATAAAEKAALRQQHAAQKAAEKAAAAAARSAAKREREEKKAAIAAEKAAQKAAAAEEKAANRRKGILASMWKNMLSHAGTSIKKILSKLLSLNKGFNTSGRTARRFSSRLREIASGALLFNGISLALRNMVSYFSKTIASTDEMKQALSNLRGAAANAASPIIQVLTPALTQLTNAVATALSYISRLATMITGKVSTAAATAAKSAQKTASAAKDATRSLAGFDQIEQLGGNSNDTDADDDSVAPNYDFQGKSPFLDSIMAAIQNGQWGQIGTLIAQKLNASLAAIPWENIQNRVKGWVQNLTDTLNGLALNVDWGLVGRSIGNGLNTLLTVIHTFFSGINWAQLGMDVAAGLNDLLTTINWELLGKTLTDKLKALFDLFHGFVSEFDFTEFGASIAKFLDAALDNIDWKQLIADVGKLLAGLFESAVAFLKEADGNTLGVLLGGLLIGAAKAAFTLLTPEITKGLSGLFKPESMEVLKSAFSSVGSWITGTLVPAVSTALGGIASALGISVGWVVAIGAAIAVVVAAVVKHWDDIVAWTKQAWEKVIKVLEPVPEWFDKNIIQPVVGFFSDLAEKISDIWNGITEFFDDVFTNLKDVFSQTWKRISSTVANIVDGIKDKVYTSFATVKNTISTILDTVKSVVSNVWNGISTTVTNVVDGIKNRVSTAFTSVKNSVASIFNSVKNTITSIWNNISSAIKGSINGIISFVNGMISGIVRGINTITGALNKLSFTVPDWLKHVPGASDIAGKKFGFNIQAITAPQIPYLADGGVIQQPTLAMMGEYAGARNNPEIAAPQSLMEETVAAVMEDVVSRNTLCLEEVLAILREILEAILGIKIGDEVIGKAAARYSRRMSRAGGY